MDEPDWQQLLELADAAVADGDYRRAFEVYAAGARAAQDDTSRKRFVNRLAILTPPTDSAPALVRVTRELEMFSSSVFVGAGLATWLKATPFYEDAKFVRLAHKHAPLLPMANWSWNLYVALWAVKAALRREGDLVELGVFRGHTTLFLAEYLDFAQLPKRWWLYDTFDGIPDDQLDPGWERANQLTYRGTFSYEEVVERFSAFPNIDVIRGRVPEVLEVRSPEKIAFMHIDLNNSTAEVAALDALFDRVCVGGVILFDDYGWSNSRAQREAESRWFAERGESILMLPTGQGLYIKTGDA